MKTHASAHIDTEGHVLAKGVRQGPHRQGRTRELARGRLFERFDGQRKIAVRGHKPVSGSTRFASFDVRVTKEFSGWCACPRGTGLDAIATHKEKLAFSARHFIPFGRPDGAAAMRGAAMRIYAAMRLRMDAQPIDDVRRRTDDDGRIGKRRSPGNPTKAVVVASLVMYFLKLACPAGCAGACSVMWITRHTQGKYLLPQLVCDGIVEKAARIDRNGAGTRPP
ncbi:MAG TPA: hypothetical protein VGL00_23045 [Terracidiphilus sp.]